jgi:hypothetical protein
MPAYAPDSHLQARRPGPPHYVYDFKPFPLWLPIHTTPHISPPLLSLCSKWGKKSGGILNQNPSMQPHFFPFLNFSCHLFFPPTAAGFSLSSFSFSTGSTKRTVFGVGKQWQS